MAGGDDELMRDAPSEPKPRRRFAPQLVEETVRSSADPNQAPIEPKSQSKERRPFAPQLVEETVLSSSNDKQDRSETTPAQAPQERRRFTPQLVEETSKSSSSKSKHSKANTAGSDEQKPRRFAPQLVEETARSSNNNSSQFDPMHGSQRSPAPGIRPTKDASVQVNDIEMRDASSQPAQARRRFAPVPIETTFDSYRVDKNPHGPTAELTPDPSPTDVLPPIPPLPSAPIIKIEAQPGDKKPKRRFAPQLIETSRRAKRAGQDGPATKPTDKTDITPGTNHIYAPKAKRKPIPNPRGSNAGLRNSEDEGSPRFLAPRRQQSMKPHPNTRRGTRNNSYHPELDTIPSSESDKSDDEDEESKVPAFTIGAPAQSIPDGESWASRGPEARNRRESCDEEFSGYLLAVAAREAYRQRELEQAMSAFPNGLRPEGVEHFFVRDNSEDDHAFDEEEPPRHGTSNLPRRKSTDPGWAVTEMRLHAEKLSRFHVDSRKMSIDEESDSMDLAPPPEDPLWTTAGPRPESRGQLHAETKGPYIAASSPRLFGSPHVLATERAFTPSPRLQPEVPGFRNSPFGNPFAAFNDDKEDRELRRMRKAASPPMLGSDLKFRLCPSPQATRMEPDHPWPTHGEASRPEEKQRDVTGNTGLWRGYCIAQANEDMAATAFQAPKFLATPMEPSSPVDPFSTAFAAAKTSGTTSPRTPASPTKRSSQHKGLHLLSGLDERLKKEMARKEREERLLAEFDDAFVTQVYNYISLGYPAMARAFDAELSKISGVSVPDLQRDDGKKIQKGFMLEMEMRIQSGSSSESNSDDEMTTPEEDEKRSHKPPRWRALRLYIHEWARQHPNLDDDGNPLAWGVRARRGSWAI